VRDRGQLISAIDAVARRGSLIDPINSIFLKLGLAAAEDMSKRVKATLLFLAQADEQSSRPPSSR
jgi:hypothetical protein